MKAVLASLKPYYYYLVGEGIKTIEVRKGMPKSEDWDRDTFFYMSKDEKSFAKIPKEFQEKYRKHFGKVGLRFVCDRIDNKHLDDLIIKEDCERALQGTCLTKQDILAYLSYTRGTDIRQNYKRWCFYGWQISNLKIYDKPKELSEFNLSCNFNGSCFICSRATFDNTNTLMCRNKLTRPPQSWCYVEVSE
ncbi:MAG: hypothetical protein IKB98_02080 [Clostridia bacterium]|nr:hypothetical protein [Clostridia bacterium]